MPFGWTARIITRPLTCGSNLYAHLRLCRYELLRSGGQGRDRGRVVGRGDRQDPLQGVLPHQGQGKGGEEGQEGQEGRRGSARSGEEEDADVDRRGAAKAARRFHSTAVHPP